MLLSIDIFVQSSIYDSNFALNSTSLGQVRFESKLNRLLTLAHFLHARGRHCYAMLKFKCLSSLSISLSLSLFSHDVIRHYGNISLSFLMIHQQHVAAAAAVALERLARKSTCNDMHKSRTQALHLHTVGSS